MQWPAPSRMTPPLGTRQHTRRHAHRLACGDTDDAVHRHARDTPQGGGDGQQKGSKHRHMKMHLHVRIGVLPYIYKQTYIYIHTHTHTRTYTHSHAPPYSVHRYSLSTLHFKNTTTSTHTEWAMSSCSHNRQGCICRCGWLLLPCYY